MCVTDDALYPPLSDVPTGALRHNESILATADVQLGDGLGQGQAPMALRCHNPSASPYFLFPYLSFGICTASYH